MKILYKRPLGNPNSRYSCKEFSVAPGETVEVSESEGQRVLADFPLNFERVTDPEPEMEDRAILPKRKPGRPRKVKISNRKKEP